MSFLEYVYNQGLIEESQFEELKKKCEKDAEKVGNALVRGRILPYKEVVKQLSLYINTSV
jgi:hypothetical protein